MENCSQAFSEGQQTTPSFSIQVIASLLPLSPAPKGKPPAHQVRTIRMYIGLQQVLQEQRFPTLVDFFYTRGCSLYQNELEAEGGSVGEVESTVDIVVSCRVDEPEAEGGNS